MLSPQNSEHSQTEGALPLL